MVVAVVAVVVVVVAVVVGVVVMVVAPVAVCWGHHSLKITSLSKTKHKFPLVALY